MACFRKWKIKMRCFKIGELKANISLFIDTKNIFNPSKFIMVVQCFFVSPCYFSTHRKLPHDHTIDSVSQGL